MNMHNCTQSRKFTLFPGFIIAVQVLQSTHIRQASAWTNKRYFKNKEIRLNCWRGNLVKSVIHVSRGHWKTKIPKCWKSYCFGYLVPVYTASDEKKTTGHLIALFTNLLCLIQRIPMSPRDAYFLYHVFMLQVTCILHKSVVIDAIKIEFVYVRLSNGIVVFI